MLAKTDISHYEHIANAIREKTGSETKYYPAEMAQAILTLEPAEWLKFKKDLVDTLDNQFDLDLTYSSTVSEILEAISGVENPDDVRAFFIDLLNEQFDLSLNYDDTDEVITQTVTAEATRLFEIEDNYNYLVDGLLRVLGSDSI